MTGVLPAILMAHLHLCPAGAVDAGLPVLQARVSRAGAGHGADGTLVALIDASSSRAQCRSMALSLPLASVQGLRGLHAATAAELGEAVTLTGRPGPLPDLDGELTGAATPALPGLPISAPARHDSGPVHGTAPPRAAWAWQEHAWRSDGERLLARAAQQHIRVLFVTVPIASQRVQHPTDLARFVAAAGRRGLAVWAVAGDPAMVRPDQHDAAVSRMRAYAAYNAQAVPAARLAGVQFDIEPYLLPDYAADPPHWDSLYLRLAAALRRAAPALPLEMVVPFWWSGKPELLAALFPHVDGLSVMDYRTDPAQVIALAQPLLYWGAVHGKQVRIALEAGKVAPQSQWRFVQADRGPLQHISFGGLDVLLLVDGEHAPAASMQPGGVASVRSFALQYRRELDGSATSFHGRLPELLTALPGLEAAFAPWRSFAGIALHGVLDD